MTVSDGVSSSPKGGGEPARPPLNPPLLTKLDRGLQRLHTAVEAAVDRLQGTQNETSRLSCRFSYLYGRMVATASRARSGVISATKSYTAATASLDQSQPITADWLSITCHSNRREPNTRDAPVVPF